MTGQINGPVLELSFFLTPSKTVLNLSLYQFQTLNIEVWLNTINFLSVTYSKFLMNEPETFNIPGGFPGGSQFDNTQPRQQLLFNRDSVSTLSTPKKSKGKQEKIVTPSSSSFKFTNTNGRPLYPSFATSSPGSPSERHTPKIDDTLTDGICETSYCNKENQSFVDEMEHLQKKLFSSKLSTNVMNEFSHRYQKLRDENIANIERLNNTTSNDELKRRSSTRYSRAHKSRFNKMESISSHYAAIRAKREKQEALRRSEAISRLKRRTNTTAVRSRPHRAVLEMPNDDMENLNKTPGQKHNAMQKVGSASKRQKTPTGDFKEVIDTPTRNKQEKEKIRNTRLGRLKKNEAYKTTCKQSDSVAGYNPPQRNFNFQPSLKDNLVPKLLFSNKHASARARTPAKSSFERDVSSFSKEVKTKPTPPLSTRHRIPSYLRPTKASLQRAVSNKELLAQDSKTNLKFNTDSTHHSNKSKISPSRACSNLHSFLTEPGPDISRNTSTPIPRYPALGSHSTFSRNLKNYKDLTKRPPLFSHPQIPKSRTVSSIPRLVKPRTSTIHKSPTSSSICKKPWQY